MAIAVSQESAIATLVGQVKIVTFVPNYLDAITVTAQSLWSASVSLDGKDIFAINLFAAKDVMQLQDSVLNQENAGAD